MKIYRAIWSDPNYHGPIKFETTAGTPERAREKLRSKLGIGSNPLEDADIVTLEEEATCPD